MTPEQHREYQRLYKERHPERVKEASRKWQQAHPEAKRLATRRWRQTPTGMAYEANRPPYLKRPPVPLERRRAYWKLVSALRAGCMVKGDCEVAGTHDGRIEAHHPFGYAGDNALAVWWMCRSHHIEMHVHLRDLEAMNATV